MRSTPKEDFSKPAFETWTRLPESALRLGVCPGLYLSPRLGRHIGGLTDNAPHEEETHDANEGREPEGGEPDQERQGHRSGSRKSGHGSEHAHHSCLGRPDTAWQHGHGATNRADRKDKDHHEKRRPGSHSLYTEVDGQDLDTPGKEGDGGSHDERPCRQQLVRSS